MGQVRALRAQLDETDSQLEDAERRAKATVTKSLRGSADSTDGGRGTGGILRVEEGLFHDLEAARDELLTQKAVRRELEGQVCRRYCFRGNEGKQIAWGGDQLFFPP